MNTRSLLSLAAAVLCYFVISSLVSQIGVTSEPMAMHFDMEITEVVALFSFLTGGAFAGVFISLFIFNYLSIRWVLLMCSGSLVLVAVANYFLDSIVFVPAAFTIMGAAGGVGMSAAALTIANTFDVEHRASMLVGADLFYALGGYLIVLLVSYLATSGARWSAGYLAVGGVSILVFSIALMARFPDTSDERATRPEGLAKERWGLNIYLIAAALFFYVMGQNAFIVWVPNYLGEIFSVDIKVAGAAVSNYWGAGALGLIISALALQKIKTGTFLVAISAGGAALTAVLLLADNPSVFTIAAALLGFVTIGSMGSMISLGVHQQQRPSVSLVPFLLCSASLGGTVSPLISSYLVRLWGVDISMVMIFSAYLSVFLLLGFVILVHNRNIDTSTGRASVEQ